MITCLLDSSLEKDDDVFMVSRIIWINWKTVKTGKHYAIPVGVSFSSLVFGDGSPAANILSFRFLICLKATYNAAKSPSRQATFWKSFQF